MKPSYQYNIEFVKPRTDKFLPNFGKQISPRRETIGMLKNHDSKNGRSDLQYNHVTKQRNIYKSIDF